MAAFLTALPRYVRLYIRLMKDPRVPLWPKLTMVGAFAYLISPFDFIPDLLLPVIGQVDDLLVLGLMFRYLVRSSPPEVVAEHMAEISGKPPGTPPGSPT